jgi:hypothetical protein
VEAEAWRSSNWHVRNTCRFLVVRWWHSWWRLRAGRPRIPVEWCVDGFDFLKHTYLVLKITNPKISQKKYIKGKDAHERLRE